MADSASARSAADVITGTGDVRCRTRRDASARVGRSPLSAGHARIHLTTYTRVCMIDNVPSRTRYNFFIENQQRQALRVVKERDGISESEQIRRAIDAWVDSRTATLKAERRRAATHLSLSSNRRKLKS
jgi:hypothetical protein